MRYIGLGVKVCNLKGGAENQQESATKSQG
jgi:hypothetical protein